MALLASHQVRQPQRAIFAVWKASPSRHGVATMRRIARGTCSLVTPALNSEVLWYATSVGVVSGAEHVSIAKRAWRGKTQSLGGIVSLAMIPLLTLDDRASLSRKYARPRDDVAIAVIFCEHSLFAN